MNAAAEVLTELQRRGISITVEGNDLCLKPGRALDDVFLSSIRQAKPAILDVLRNRTTAQAHIWPSASLDADHRFGQPHAKLFPFIGRKVRTPAGPGTLVQVFAQQVTVLLDSDVHRCSFFRPGEIVPVSWDL